MICRMGGNFVEMGVEILRREMPGFIVNSRIQTISSKKHYSLLAGYVLVFVTLYVYMAVRW